MGNRIKQVQNSCIWNVNIGGFPTEGAILLWKNPGSATSFVEYYTSIWENTRIRNYDCIVISKFIPPNDKFW